jgi:hypothetical protein
MALTLTEIQERLKQLDEITLMELLEISSEDLVDRFIDLIEDRADELEEQVDD